MSTSIPFSSPVTQALTQAGVSYRVFTHPGPVKSLEQAAQERGQIPAQVIRSLLFRLPDNRFLMILASGPDQLPWKIIRKYLGVSQITMATDTEVEQITGYLPGSVSPFGTPQALRVLVDRRILEQTEVSIGSGVRGTTVILSVPDLLKTLGTYEEISFDRN
jgi:Cys-tRNA(Pro) deacylase